MKRKKSSSTESFYVAVESPVGTLYLLFTENTLRGIEFRRPNEMLRRSDAPASIIRELREYFAHGRQNFTQKISLTKGSDFDRNVWLALREIPYGETRTYKWLAEQIGKPNAFRAVGQSLGRNPLPIILPCHRVIESDGSLGGYSAGTDIKRRLLDIEYYIKLTKEV
ncbi:MAG: methylated-DNA--[protein]-cysteine S-methyltransferase [Nitrospirota bacterium]